MEEKIKQENKYGTTKPNMSAVMNKGVNICCKPVTTGVFTSVGIIVELSTSITKSNISLEEYHSIN